MNEFVNLSNLLCNNNSFGNWIQFIFQSILKNSIDIEFEYNILGELTFF